MNPRIRLNHRLLAVLGTATIALAGCTPGGATAGPSPSPSVNVQAAALEYAKCLRANGYPDFPDPIHDDALGWTFPESAPNVKPDPPQCLPLGRHLKDLIRGDRDRVNAQDLAKRRDFAKCMRENGVPNFPDPDADGNFTWPDGTRPDENDPSLRQGEDACVKYLPPKDPDKSVPTPAA